MQSATETGSIIRNDSAKGAVMLITGLLILFFATKYVLFSSGLVEKPAPGTLWFRIFDFFRIF